MHLELPFRGLPGSAGGSRLLDRACIAPIHANRHSPAPPRPRLSPTDIRPTYARTRDKHRPIHDQHTAKHGPIHGAQCPVTAISETICRHCPAIPVDFAPGNRLPSEKFRDEAASATDEARSSSRPSRSTLTRFSTPKRDRQTATRDRNRDRFDVLDWIVGDSGRGDGYKDLGNQRIVDKCSMPKGSYE